MRFKWMEHLSKACDAFFEDLISFIPEKSRDHLKNARKEMLLALKAVIEKRIEEIEKSKKQVKKVEVEEE